MSSSDCLVLCVEEIDTDYDNFSDYQKKSRLYVLFDVTYGVFLIRGRRDNTEPNSTFSFIADSNNQESVVNFIDFFTLDEPIIMTIYNMNELPLTSEEITCEYLEENSIEENIFLSYRQQDFSKSTLRKIMDIIKNIYNHY